MANSLVRDYINRKGIKQTALTKDMQLTQAAISRILTGNDMYVGRLMQFCEALNHDFFADLSRELRKRGAKYPKSEDTETDYLGALVAEKVEEYFKRKKKP